MLRLVADAVQRVVRAIDDVRAIRDGEARKIGVGDVVIGDCQRGRSGERRVQIVMLVIGRARIGGEPVELDRAEAMIAADLDHGVPVALILVAQRLDRRGIGRDEAVRVRRIGGQRITETVNLEAVARDMLIVTGHAGACIEPLLVAWREIDLAAIAVTPTVILITAQLQRIERLVRRGGLIVEKATSTSSIPRRSL